MAESAHPRPGQPHGSRGQHGDTATSHIRGTCGGAAQRSATPQPRRTDRRRPARQTPRPQRQTAAAAPTGAAATPWCPPGKPAEGDHPHGVSPDRRSPPTAAGGPGPPAAARCPPGRTTTQTLTHPRVADGKRCLCLAEGTPRRSRQTSGGSVWGAGAAALRRARLVALRASGVRADRHRKGALARRLLGRTRTHCGCGPQSSRSGAPKGTVGHPNSPATSGGDGSTPHRTQAGRGLHHATAAAL